MTTKHHEGFCNFDTKLTDYCAPKQGPGRDLVKEYVEAARAEGLRVGFYYSLMDWHHPDGARCATDEAARQRFVDYIHGQIRELLTNYGKIDILWYDVSWPLDAKGWESEKMNEMVFQLQPDIIVNNRNKLPGDFATPEQRISADEARLGILHDHERQLGLPEGRRQLEDAQDHRAQPDHLRARQRQLSAEYRTQGRWLHPGGIGQDHDRRSASGWQRNGKTIYDTEVCQPRRSNYASFTRKGNTLYMHVHFWPGDTVALGGLMNKVKSARLLRHRQAREVRAGQVPRALHRPARESARRPGHHARHRVRRRAAAGHRLRPQRAPSG